ncbi:hypothetical protein LINPERPRIM_LOCUS2706 [Linum perenne]
MRAPALHALQYAIDQYEGRPWENANCVTDPSHNAYSLTITASAQCTNNYLTTAQCKACLRTAKHVLVDKVCRHVFGGILVLNDCHLTYFNDYSSFCAH